MTDLTSGPESEPAADGNTVPPDGGDASPGKHRSRRGLLGGIVVLATGTSVERILGYLRDVGLAAFFGLGTALDAYNVALSIPLFICSLFPGVGGARITALLIPLYIEFRDRTGVEDARRLAQTVMSLLLIFLTAVGGVIFLWPQAVVKVFAPGFTGEAADTTAVILRMLVVVLIFWGMAGFLRAFLLAHEKFAPAALAHMAANFSLVLYVFLVGKRYGIHGVAWATVVATSLLLVFQAPTAKRLGLRAQFLLVWRHPGLKRFSRLAGPVVVGLGIVQMNALVDRILASTLEVGSVSVLTYANRIRSLPLELFIVSVNQAVFPRLCREYTRAGVEGMREVALFSVRVCTAGAVPAVVGLLVLRHPVAQLAFGHGSVSPEGVLQIGGTLGCYVLGLLTMAVAAPMAMMFFAIQDTKTPTILSAVSLALNVALNLLLIGPLGIYGLALATSISATFYGLVSMTVLSRRLGGIGGRRIADSFGRAFGASIVMGLSCALLLRVLARFWPMGGTVGLAWRLGITIVVGGLVYLAFGSLFRVRGMGLAWHMLRERMGRTR